MIRWTRAGQYIASPVWEASSPRHNFAIMRTPTQWADKGDWYLTVEDKAGNVIAYRGGASVAELKALVAKTEK